MSLTPGSSGSSGPPAAQTQKEVFDEISLNVISFLENHACVSDVHLIERAGVSTRDLASWEKTNQPTKLPQDLRSFLQLFDGLELRWKVMYQGRCASLQLTRRCARLTNGRTIRMQENQSSWETCT